MCSGVSEHSSVEPLCPGTPPTGRSPCLRSELVLRPSEAGGLEELELFLAAWACREVFFDYKTMGLFSQAAHLLTQFPDDAPESVDQVIFLRVAQAAEFC